jgi:hypothetical protein
LIYIVTSEDWTKGCMGDAYCNDRVAALVRADCVHLDIAEAQKKRFKPTDHVVTFVNPPGWHPNCSFWLFAVDETIGGNPPYAKQVKRCADFRMTGVVTTYANPQHLQVLKDAGLKTVYFPLCVKEIRPRTTKTVGLLLTGQDDIRTYPERARLGHLLRDTPGFYGLAPPGYWPNLRHDTVGEKYLQLVDSADLVITDCAGDKDRFVAKYIEAAECHALPIGNVPSYMPDELKKLICNTEGMPAADVLREVDTMLGARAWLLDRQESYSAAVARLYDATDHALRVTWEIEHGQAARG